MNFSFTLNSTKLAIFMVHFATSFNVLSAVGLGGSEKIRREGESGKENAMTESQSLSSLLT